MSGMLGQTVLGLALLAVFFPFGRSLFLGAVPDDSDYRHLYPIVHVGVRVFDRFSAHTLSHFLGTLETWRYPKDRTHISFFVDSAVGADELTADLKRWSETLAPRLFRSAVVRRVESDAELSGDNWRELSLTDARRRSATFALITDTNCHFTYDALHRLVELLHGASQNTSEVAPAVVAPLLDAPFPGGLSNLDGLMDESFVKRQTIGSRRVYYADGPLLIYLRHRDAAYLSFDMGNVREYRGTGAPIDVLAFSAFSMNVHIVVDNSHFYGHYFSPTGRHATPLAHQRMFNTYLANRISDVGPGAVLHSTVVVPRFPPDSKFGFNAVFLINLARRPERLRKMTAVLDVLGVDFEAVEAVDGSQLTEAELAGLRFLPGYEDPYHRRPIKRGEVGCFLSHLAIWRRLADGEEGLERVIVLEDDVRFTADGLQTLAAAMEDIVRQRTDWEFIYLGRKPMSTNEGEERFVPGHRHLSTVGYSYWTLGYAITRRGAQKLLAVRPLDRLMALDEFLPIMYGRHPNRQWSDAFGVAPADQLKAFTVYPLVVEPERYTHQPGYVSDTEGSPIVDLGRSGATADLPSSQQANGLLLPLVSGAGVRSEL